MGFGLAELLVTMSLFSLVGLLTAVALHAATRRFTAVDERQSAFVRLSKVKDQLHRELRLASLNAVKLDKVPASLPGGAWDGAALWFLSSVSPVTGEMVCDATGAPIWQVNVLYYLVVPANHQALIGFDCQGGAASDGFDDRCPHKVLLRKVVDNPGASSQELLTAAQLSPLLTRPNGYDLSALKAEPGVQQVKIIAKDLLGFRATLGADPNFPREMDWELQAVSLKDAQKNLAVGRVSCSNSRYTTVLQCATFLEGSGH